MIIPNKNRLNDEEYQLLNDIAAEFKCKVGTIVGETITLYPIIGDETSSLMIKRFEGLPFVARVQRMQTPYKLMAISNTMVSPVVKVGKVKIGGGNFTIIAGHCAIDPENPSLFLETALAAKEAGAHILRAGVWKPRTNPHSFQGEDKSLETLLEARTKTGLPIDTEVMDRDQLKLALDAEVDILQIGARNALNYGLLKLIARNIKGKKTAVILKRSIHMGSIIEFISAAEYLASTGNTNIMLCPRGTLPTIEGFRYNPDSSITQLLKRETWAPVIVDPSHAVGHSRYVPRASLAAAAYGADGLLIETHIDPKRGIGDDPKQAVTPAVLKTIIEDCRKVQEIGLRYNLKIFLKEQTMKKLLLIAFTALVTVIVMLWALDYIRFFYSRPFSDKIHLIYMPNSKERSLRRAGKKMSETGEKVSEGVERLREIGD